MRRPVISIAIAGAVLFGLAACGSSGPQQRSLFNNSDYEALVRIADGTEVHVKPGKTRAVSAGAVLVVPKTLSCTWHSGTYDSPKDADPETTVVIDRAIFLEECLVQHS